MTHFRIRNGKGKLWTVSKNLTFSNIQPSNAQTVRDFSWSHSTIFYYIVLYRFPQKFHFIILANSSILFSFFFYCCCSSIRSFFIVQISFSRPLKYTYCTLHQIVRIFHSIFQTHSFASTHTTGTLHRDVYRKWK